MVAATFTAEPLQETLDFWADQTGLFAHAEFAPFDQVFQQLLNPGSVLSANSHGLNVVLVRLEDWVRNVKASDGSESIADALARNTHDLTNAIRAAVARSSTPFVVALCPNSLGTLTDREIGPIFAAAANRIAAELDSIAGVCLIRSADFDQYPVADFFDARREQLGHIPYTPTFFAALGTLLARRAHALLSPPSKVVVVDCDNTLWKGVVGEDGVDGITIPPAWRAVQSRLVELADMGFLICLCSKNDEADVLNVFDRRSDMVLKREHLVSWRVNWEPKSLNIRSLGEELNLGLDSFIFLDDNPLECAEVRAGCPEVTTLRLPIEGDMESFLKHVWVFDRLRVTSEDRKRTAMYQQEADRARYLKEAPTIQEFLAGLNLQVVISEPTSEQIGRVAQLTQRTNQFNFTTVRRNEAEIRALGDSGLECRAVEVRDRFGDYGLVGVMIFGSKGDALEIDSFLLSCRVLGRGVEHRMLAELGAIARERKASVLRARLVTTKKNQPARDFLEKVAEAPAQGIDGGWIFDFAAEQAANLVYHPASSESSVQSDESTGKAATATAAVVAEGKSERYERIARELASPEQVLAAVNASVRRIRPRPERLAPFVPPRSQIETEMAKLWAEVLRLEGVGITDDYFELGGTSLLAVDLFACIERQFGRKLPLTALLESPTVEKLALKVVESGDQESIVLIREGQGRPPIFLVHDGDGETMLYRNLALRLTEGHAVYGLQPYALSGVPMAHTRITDMAAYHVRRMRSIQPEGPYYVGGMCAGGVIAFEIALQLERAGQDVALVALIDAADARAQPKTWRVANKRLRNFSSTLREDQQASLGRRAWSISIKVARKVKNLTSYLVGQTLKEMGDRLRMRAFRFLLDGGRSVPRLLQQISVRTVYVFAEKDYLPSEHFRGELTLFRATEGKGADAPYVEIYEDPMLGWGERTIQGVRVYDIPGGHSSMLQEPNVAVIAKRLQEYINDTLNEDLASSSDSDLGTGGSSEPLVEYAVEHGA